jgi:hypothetical protein
MDQIRPAVGCVHNIAMTSSLQGGKRVVFGGENVFLRMGLIWTPDIPRPGQRDGVVVACASFGCQQVVPLASLVEVGSFHQR